MSIYSSTIRPGNDVSLSVRPEITQSEKNVKGIDMKTRGCAFADEVTPKSEITFLMFFFRFN